MMRSIAILGRQPAIGRAELESLYGADSLQPIAESACGIALPTDEIDFKRLGSSVKLARYLTTIETTDWQKLEDYLVKELPNHVCCIPEGKLTLGLSVIGLKLNPKRLNATALTLKKVVRDTGRPCRIVPNKSLELSSAQVLHNKLFTSHNWELLLIRDGNKTHLAQTTHVQDIDAYAARDQARPMRDARVGMLPPKLAQTIINLTNPQENFVVLDPFCGTGVVLQEALLMGYGVYGSDLEQRMVDYTNQNLDWLIAKYNLGDVHRRVEQQDATEFVNHDVIDVVACETYLGRPFSTQPDHLNLQKVIQDCDTIHEKFLKQFAAQLPSGVKLCIAVPAWFVRGKVYHLKTLASLESLGYNRVSFAHADHKELIYHREGQIVGRELVVLTRK